MTRKRQADRSVSTLSCVDKVTLVWHTLYAHTMPTKRAHILLPDDLLREIDSLVGPRGRSSFLVETARTEVRRQKLLQFLEGKAPAGREPAWRDSDHPELAAGADAWVRKLRAENDARADSRPSSRGKRTRNR